MTDAIATPAPLTEPIFAPIQPPPPVPPASSPLQASLPPPQPFVFTGSGSEFFRIWIVNLLLSIVTLGIYSAWAKVRTAKYFYNNTTVAGANFDYHGNPLSILKGRLIAVAAIATYSGAGYISKGLGLALFLMLAALLPWLLWKGLQFSFYNSSYRSVRFGFAGSTGKAYKVFLLFPILTPFTLYILLPFAHHEIKRFVHGEARFGRHSFSFKSCAGDFYIAYVLGMILMMGVLLVLMVLGGIAVFLASLGVGGGIGVVLLYLSMFAIAPIIVAKLQNSVWNHTSLGEHTFVSNLPVGQFVWVTLSNFFLIALTLGLFIPFAKVRLARIKISALTFVPRGPLDHFMAAAPQQVGATGEGMADLLDVDISL
jgi:uncharacterized membrane protein YjgN (DUF898 family)